MAVDLSSYDTIGSALLVRISVGVYRSGFNAEPMSTVLKFTDSNTSISVNTTGGAETYVGTGQLMSVTTSRSELKASGSDITISLSGIPNSSIDEIVNSTIKGSRVEVYRVLTNTGTGQPLNITGNPVGRFFGIITNYALEEDYDADSRTSTNTISLICSSWIGVLDKKIAGRKTNPYDQKLFYPGDTSMDRVPSLVGANYQFGSPE